MYYPFNVLCRDIGLHTLLLLKHERLGLPQTVLHCPLHICPGLSFVFRMSYWSQHTWCVLPQHTMAWSRHYTLKYAFMARKD